MTTGRSVNKYTRVYVDGYDLSGYARTIGPLECTFQEGDDNPMNVAVVGKWLGQARISPGSLSAIFDNTATTGLHALMSGAGVKRNVMVAQGIQAAPAVGDPVFVCQVRQNDYLATPAETPSAVTIQFGQADAASSNLNYSQPWGVLLNAGTTAATTDNSAVGITNYGTSDGSSDGGYMMYQVLSCNGTAAIKVQDADTNVDGSFADLLTSGTIDFSNPTAGVVALARTAAVKQFLRWQVEWGTATTITFLLAFVRNKIL